MLFIEDRSVMTISARCDGLLSIMAEAVKDVCGAGLLSSACECRDETRLSAELDGDADIARSAD
eukprot:1058161-Prymnesium_polylepis.1